MESHPQDSEAQVRIERAIEAEVGRLGDDFPGALAALSILLPQLTGELPESMLAAVPIVLDTLQQTSNDDGVKVRILFVE